MKLLRVKASNFKNCADDFTIDLVAKSRKTSEDKEYELQQIADELYVYNTAAFVGKNASGKTTAIQLLDCCYSILGDFRLENKNYDYNDVQLEIIFYHEKSIYRYCTVLQPDTTLQNKAIFTEQHLYVKPYHKSKMNKLYSEDSFTELTNLGALPEDTANVFFALQKRQTRAVFFNCDGEGVQSFQLLFKALQNYHISSDVLLKIIRIFDENIDSLEKADQNNYLLTYQGVPRTVSDVQLLHFLSSGTTKGLLLYIFVVASLQQGFDLLVDEVENHFHKTLVENMISLYKDQSVNRKHASLIFTTHYCEILDLFNRQDNIWISRADTKVSLYNMYDDFDLRSELLKSRQFYHNAFQTAVNYEELMNLKRALKK